MATIQSHDVASMFLRAINAPDTPTMRRAVSIWLSRESGNTIIGNNPWNLHSGANCPPAKRYCPGNGALKGQIGNRYAGPGDQNVAVFATLQDGVNANARNLENLKGSGYGYDKVLAQARSGSALGFLTALQTSAWSASRYGGNGLTNSYRSLSTFNSTITLQAPRGSSGDFALVADVATTTTLDKALGMPTDTYINEGNVAELRKRIDDLLAQGKITPQQAEGLRGSLITALVSETLAGRAVKLSEITVVISTGAVATQEFDPGGFIEDNLPGGNILAAIADPENWKYAAALAIGIPLAFVGFYLLAGVQTAGANA